MLDARLIGSMWSMRAARSPVVGRVLAFDGHCLTLILIGLAEQNLDGGEVILDDGGDRRYARIPAHALRETWTRLDA